MTLIPYDPDKHKGRKLYQTVTERDGDVFMSVNVEADVSHEIAALAPWHYMVEITEEDLKGGPGSGHWGHAGRPPARGGSSPGKMGGTGRVNPRYFTIGPGRRLIEHTDEDLREDLISVITKEQVQPRHLRDITAIRSIDPTLPEDSPNVDDLSTVPEYWSKGTRGIYDTETGIIEITEDFEGASMPKDMVISHELGHAVTAYAIEYERDDQIVRGSEVKPEFKVLKDVFYKKFDFAFVRVNDFALASMGLSPNSVVNRVEFAAEAWRVYHMGTDRQIENFEDYTEINLEELFGGRA